MLQSAEWDLSQETRVSVCSVDQWMVNFLDIDALDAGGVRTVGS